MSILEFNLEKRGGARIWISQSYTDPLFVDLLADPDRLLSDAQCHVIKDQEKIKVGQLTVNIGSGAARSLYVKRYNAFSLRYTLLSTIVRSGALRSLQGAEILKKAGIPIATPVAAVENRRCGMIRKSFFVSEEISGGKTADAYWIDELQHRKGHEGFRSRLDFLRQLAGLFHSLHAQRIYHNDLKDANILVVVHRNGESIELLLLDLEGVRRYSRLSERRRVKNLVQLYRTLGRYVPSPQRLFFLKCYLGPSFVDRHLKRKLIRRVLRLARQVEHLKARRAIINTNFK
ncbi:MAG: lipopolysaccharide kinase InaA family protein [Candidatus Binatia bacterium]